ncbi:thioredoxin family protein [Algivirga pacifica]|uniref:Thioredoxin family protein n=1 Tax=Algivirga pacifica TaxID=1162670 RepID=A0ABP9D185_9BACT
MAYVETNDQGFKNEVESNEKVMVKFYAGWCGSCKLFKGKYRRISEDEQYNGVKFLYINAEENPEARKAAGVTNLPFFATFKNGSLVAANATNKEDVVRDMITAL